MRQHLSALNTRPARAAPEPYQGVMRQHPSALGTRPARAAWGVYSSWSACILPYFPCITVLRGKWRKGLRNGYLGKHFLNAPV